MGDQGVAEHALLRGNLGLLAASSFGLVVAGWVGLIRQPPKLVWWSALMAGNLSYGIYLFHNAAPVLLRQLDLQLSSADFIAASVFLTMIVAAVVHYAVERPLRSAGRNIAASVEERRR
jgi:peptidoglycan/LPS O-acetylase OafA/YrhL